MRTILSTLSATLAASAAFAQLPCTQLALGTNLLLTDESISAAQALGFNFVYNGVGYSSIQVCDNGYVTLGASGGAAEWNVDAAAMCAEPYASIRPLWIDLEPGVTGSGDVYFNAVPAQGSTPAYAVITWDNVFEYFGTTPHSFQLFLIDGGGVRCTYGQNLSANTNEWLIGASQGVAATPNPVSFAALPIVTGSNPTLHEYNGGGAVPYGGNTYDWLPTGTGGFIVTQASGCAGFTNYGVGCVRKYQSFYEHFLSTPSIDLSNTAFRMLLAGPSYIVMPSANAFVAPSATATNLNLGDDTSLAVTLSAAFPFPGGTTTSLEVSSNGFVSTQAGNGNSYTPNPADLLNRFYPSWNVWHDFIGNATGNVFFEEVGGVAYVTWNGMIGYVGTNPGTATSTFQMQFELATGNVDVVFGAMDTVSISGWTGGDGYVVGYSPGNAALDPGSIDLSAAIPATIQTSSTDIHALAISSSAVPAAGTTIQLVTDNIPSGTLFGAVLFGLIKFDPGLPLASIGMDGCSRYNDGSASLLFFPAGSSHSTPFTLPNVAGVTVQAQSAVLCPTAGLTALGAITSGGLELRIN